MSLSTAARHEDARLEAVRQYEPFGSFDHDADTSTLELARDLFEVSAAFVSFVDRDEQVFPLRLGLALCGTDREVSFCTHVVAQEEMLVVLDATLDPRFCANPLVTGEPRVRFYAGTPLVSPTGHVVGTLCLIDTRPRSAFSDAKRRHLRRLAAIMLDKLELRRLRLAGEVSQIRFENIAATSPDGIICADSSGRITFWNAASVRLFGHPASRALGQSLELIVPPRMRRGHGGGLGRVAAGGKPRLVGTIVELTALRIDASEFPVELSLSMWHEKDGVNFGAILRDITERRADEAQLVRLAHHDPLTGLPNRAALRHRLAGIAEGTAPAALLSVDLDQFKAVNDDLGHAAGDAVLCQVAARLLGCVRASDTVARLGGDEFALLLHDVADPARAGEVAQSVIQALSRPMSIGNEGGNGGEDRSAGGNGGERETVCVGASVGIAIHAGDGRSIDELLSDADLALYQAKSDGRSCHRAYSPGLRQAMNRKRAYDNELRRAHDGHEFEVFYQPQLRLSGGALVGAEALLRWRHPTDGLLPPAAFMPGLENRPVSVAVGHWVMRTACAQAAAWRDAGAPGFRIGVNLFGSQFQAGDLVERVHEALSLAGLPANALELEVTENIILRHDETMLGPLRRLRAEGVQIAFDDYGTGYASLSMLKRVPITRLKVDKSFVQGICETPHDAAIVSAILYLGQRLGLSIIAEGVETEEQAARLRRKCCEEVQGYLFGRPMPAAEFAARFGLDGAAVAKQGRKQG